MEQLIFTDGYHYTTARSPSLLVLDSQSWPTNFYLFSPFLLVTNPFPVSPFVSVNYKFKPVKFNVSVKLHTPRLHSGLSTSSGNLASNVTEETDHEVWASRTSYCTTAAPLDTFTHLSQLHRGDEFSPGTNELWSGGPFSSTFPDALAHLAHSDSCYGRMSAYYCGFHNLLRRRVTHLLSLQRSAMLCTKCTLPDYRSDE